jgi:hypothetical protein
MTRRCAGLHPGASWGFSVGSQESYRDVETYGGGSGVHKNHTECSENLQGLDAKRQTAARANQIPLQHFDSRTKIGATKGLRPIRLPNNRASPAAIRPSKFKRRGVAKGNPCKKRGPRLRRTTWKVPGRSSRPPRRRRRTGESTVPKVGGRGRFDGGSWEDRKVSKARTTHSRGGLPACHALMPTDRNVRPTDRSPSRTRRTLRSPLTSALEGRETDQSSFSSPHL